MKKFYFLLTLLFSLVGVTQTFAQNEESIQINISNGQWTVCNANKTWATQWSTYSQDPLVTVTSHPASGGGTAATDARGNSFYGNNNMNNYDGNNIKFFNSPKNDGDAHKYEVAVSMGWYIKSVSFDFCSESANGVSVSFPDSEDEPTFSAGQDDVKSMSFEPVDETGIVAFLIHNAGENTFARTSNFIVTIYKQSEAAAAKEELSAKLEELRAYKDAFRTGTAPGLYDAEKVAAFQTAIEEADGIADNPDLDDLPDEELASVYRGMTGKLTATYEAILASKIPMGILPNGYYRIKSGLTFYKETTVTDEETQEEITTTEYFDKYLYTEKTGDVINARWATPDDVTTDCPSLWYISKKEEGYDFRSVATEGRFNTGKPVTLTINGENLVAIDAVTTDEEGVTYVNLRLTSNKANSGQVYFHCGGHSSGKGTDGGITLWYASSENADPDASSWVFVPVSEEDAQAAIDAYAPIHDREIMLYNYQTTLADAKKNLEIAKDMQRIELITDISQITFVKTDPSEGKEEAILDNDPSTFWHSDWHDKESYGRPSLTIELAEPVQTFTWSITRRASANDHVTKGIIYAGNDVESLAPVIEDLEIENATNNGVFEKFIDLGAPYKFVKFEFTESNNNTRNIANPENEEEKLVYAHFAEFHMLDIQPNENAQVRFMGDLATNLQTVIDAQADMEIDDIMPEHYEALKAAYDAFMRKFIDPTELRELLKEMKGAANIVVTGEQPGFWHSNSEAAIFNATYDAAVAYDEKGDYSPEQSKNYIESLNSMKDNIYASAIKIQTGKWYRIRFATETTIEEGEEVEGEFEKYGWDKVAGNGTYNNDSTILVNEPLFGKYITVSYLDNDETANIVVSGVEAEEFGLGSGLFFDDEEDIEDETLSLFRFIAVGDSAYIIQNKGTSLFLKAAGGSGAVTLSAHPSLFNVRAIGYGENVIAARSITGDNQNYLHAQVSQNRLVTWNASTPGSRSGLYIEEDSDVESDYQGNEFQTLVIPGSLNTYCFPVEVAAIDGQMWGVLSVDAENNGISLMKMEKAVAGRPFIFIYGDTKEYSEDGGKEPARFTLSFNIAAKEPQTADALKGTFASTRIDRGDLYASGSGFAVNKVALTDVMDSFEVPANSAYVSTESKFNTNAEVIVTFDEDAEDGIQTALANVSRSGAVYTIDGRLVSKKATLNELSRFGKGIYILNGTKVVVK